MDKVNLWTRGFMILWNMEMVKTNIFNSFETFWSEGK